MRFKLEKYKSAGLAITVNDQKKDYKVYGKTRTRIGATQDLKSKITKAITGLSEKDEEYFEKELRLEKGTLSPKSPYWRSWGIFIDMSGTYLDDELPEDALAIKVLKARPDVADSTHEAKTKLRASNSPIEYVLSNAENEADSNIESTTNLMKAMLLLNEMNVEQMRDFLTMRGELPNSMSDKLIRARVNDIAINESKKFIDMMDDPNKKDILFINELVNYTILKKFGAQFIDANKQIIAFSMPDMISFIKNPENSKQVAGLKKELSLKKKERV
jgi:hypothetical protein